MLTFGQWLMEDSRWESLRNGFDQNEKKETKKDKKKRLTKKVKQAEDDEELRAAVKEYMKNGYRIKKKRKISPTHKWMLEHQNGFRAYVKWKDDEFRNCRRDGGMASTYDESSPQTLSESK